jgi:hypothetical protein
MLKVPVAVLLKIPRGVSWNFLLRCCWMFLHGFAEGSSRGLPKVPTGVCRRYLQRCCWRLLQGFAECSYGGVGEGSKSSGILLYVIGSDILKDLKGSWPRNLKAVCFFETSESINPTTAEHLGWSDSSVRYSITPVHAWCEMPVSASLSIRPVFYVHYCAALSITTGEDQYFLVLAVSVASLRLAEFVFLCYVMAAKTPSGQA